MVEKCGVCNEQESKYKCPHCLLRYCSVKCFKIHLAAHEEDDQLTTAGAGATAQQETESPPVQSIDSPQTTAQPLKRSLQDLKDDPRLANLFVKYPTLRPQLQEIFSMTLPSYMNGGSDRGSMTPGGGMTPNGGSVTPGGSDYASHFQRKKNQISGRGQWSQEKADKAALRRLADIAARDEGIREFVELCALVVEPGEEGGDEV